MYRPVRRVHCCHVRRSLDSKPRAHRVAEAELIPHEYGEVGVVDEGGHRAEGPAQSQCHEASIRLGVMEGVEDLLNRRKSAARRYGSCLVGILCALTVRGRCDAASERWRGRAEGCTATSCPWRSVAARAATRHAPSQPRRAQGVHAVYAPAAGAVADGVVSWAQIGNAVKKSLAVLLVWSRVLVIS